jgi:predicted secreted protein
LAAKKNMTMAKNSDYRSIGFFILLSSSLTASLAFAGDAATLRVIGFSADGKYLAFEQHGVEDGSGFPYANVFFVDVENNSFIAPSVAVREENEEALATSMLATARQRAQTALQRLNIIEGNLGAQLIHHPLTDTGVDPHVVKFSLSPALAGSADQPYEIVLREAEVKEDCYGFGKGRIFELALVNAQTGARKILQKDERLPKARGCPLSYRIQDVFVYDERYVAVFLNVLKPGFEGHDMRFMVVTGVLE